ncbi:hypothetical protein [uncultured Jannaschia sp.]|uniref:hypothetical protein n=1 Tax=uncultured Jannaschia sp. TaxID=293347 RepID=UPI0026076DFA|nr:hypothetical protein [uncultured Jannaschia sp.]
MTHFRTGFAALALAFAAIPATAQTQGAKPRVVAVTPPPGATLVDPGMPSPFLTGGDYPDGTVLVPPARTTFDFARAPAGYEPAWDDGRLNPYRGPRTLLGDEQTRGIWTVETPRRQREVIRIAR